jgi:hypothetical protein
MPGFVKLSLREILLFLIKNFKKEKDVENIVHYAIKEGLSV